MQQVALTSNNLQMDNIYISQKKKIIKEIGKDIKSIKKLFGLNINILPYDKICLEYYLDELRATLPAGDKNFIIALNQDTDNLFQSQNVLIGSY